MAGTPGVALGPRGKERARMSRGTQGLNPVSPFLKPASVPWVRRTAWGTRAAPHHNVDVWMWMWTLSVARNVRGKGTQNDAKWRNYMGKKENQQNKGKEQGQ